MSGPHPSWAYQSRLRRASLKSAPSRRDCLTCQHEVTLGPGGILPPDDPTVSDYACELPYTVERGLWVSDVWWDGPPGPWVETAGPGAVPRWEAGNPCPDWGKK